MLGIRDTVGLPKTVLADTGYASGPAVKALKANRVEPLVAIERTQPHRPYDFRPPPSPRHQKGSDRVEVDHSRLQLRADTLFARSLMQTKAWP